MDDRETELTISDLRLRFQEFGADLSPARKRIFENVSPELSLSVSALLPYAVGQTNLESKGLVDCISRLSFQCSEELWDDPVPDTDRNLSSLVFQLGFEAAGLIKAFGFPDEDQFIDDLAMGMLRLGHARGALAVVDAPWAKAFMTGQDSDVLVAIQASRKAGGKVRAKQLQEQASDWKAEALPIAIEYDRKHPKIDRQRLAMAVLERLESRSKPGSVKSVENWLRNEIESLGLVRSRSRKKSAS